MEAWREFASCWGFNYNSVCSERARARNSRDPVKLTVRQSFYTRCRRRRVLPPRYRGRGRRRRRGNRPRPRCRRHARPPSLRLLLTAGNRTFCRRSVGILIYSDNDDRRERERERERIERERESERA